MKSNKILIGVIIILIGLFSLQRNFLGVSFGALTITVIGLAFLLLYRQKRAIWSLFVGGYMFSMGFTRLLSGWGLGSPQALAGLFFIVPGAIFMLLYFDKNKHGLLVPASMLIWLGIALMVAGVFKLRAQPAFGVLVMCVGFSFCTVYLIGRSYISRGLLYLGGGLAVVGVLFSGGLGRMLNGRTTAYALIVIGVLIVLTSILYKPRS